ncbi:hypothetical protein V1525DRAFT_422308 [Lipomyces kononenkoae]|uniref:Uncharacterized protein n=1 Tax=Lipomyces kononenkoae TaxID=34357 RepID=A0ACC3SSL6_LIPKO
MSKQNNELLIPPVVTLSSAPPPPPPSDPPTKDDVNRALLYKNMIESSLSGISRKMVILQIITSDSAIVPDLRATVENFANCTTYYEQSLGLDNITLADADLNDKFDRMDRRIAGKIDRLEEQMIRQELNRERSRNNRPGTKVPFVDGSLSSSKGISALMSAAGIDRLSAREVRALAGGHGLSELHGADTAYNY